MAFNDELQLSDLLAPIPGDSPVGPDLKYSNEFSEIEWAHTQGQDTVPPTKSPGYPGADAEEHFGNVVEQQYGRFPDEPHTANFIDCVRTRETPNADIEQGHGAACLEHLANLSYRLGNVKLTFDGQTETFVDNDEANAHLKPSYREPYRVPDKV